jgi:hypothetical protein
MDKKGRSASRDLMPPPPTAPKSKNASQKTHQSSKPKSTKPKQDTPIKKKKKTSQEVKKQQFLPPISEIQAREELQQGATYEDFMKWGDLTKENLREFCKKALNKDGKKI